MGNPIPSSFVAGDVPTPAQINAFGLALKALGLIDDDGGKLAAPIACLDLPFTIRSGAAGLRPRVVGPSTTFTVGAGKLCFFRQVSNAAAGAITVTPSGGSAIALSVSTATIEPSRIGLCLGAGDQLTTPASSALVGVEVDVAAVVGSPSRILRVVDNASTYTVPAGKLFILTHATPVSGGPIGLSIDGTIALYAAAIGSITGGRSYNAGPLVVTQSLSVAGSDATDWLLSGLEYSVA